MVHPNQRNRGPSILLQVPSLEDSMTLVQIVPIDLGKKPFVRDDDEAHDDEVKIST